MGPVAVAVAVAAVAVVAEVEAAGGAGAVVVSLADVGAEALSQEADGVMVSTLVDMTTGV